MYVVTVTLRNGKKLVGILNARNERHAVAQARNTVQGQDAKAVEATRSW